MIAPGSAPKGRAAAPSLVLAAAALAALLSACGAAPPPPAPPPAPAGEPVAEATATTSDDTATLDIDSGQVKDVKVDGKTAGKTPITGFRVDPGTHDVAFTDPSTGDTTTMSVTVGPGQSGTVRYSPPPSINESMKPDAPKKK